MIARIWRATATPGNAATYQHHFASHVVPHLRTIAGFSGALLLRREGARDTELLAVTLWQSLDSIRAFAGPDPGKANVDADAQAMLKTFETTADNYQMVVDQRNSAA